MLSKKTLPHVTFCIDDAKQNKRFFDYMITLRNLVPLVQYKKHEKHPWRSITFSKVAV